MYSKINPNLPTNWVVQLLKFQKQEFKETVIRYLYTLIGEIYDISHDVSWHNYYYGIIDGLIDFYETLPSNEDIVVLNLEEFKMFFIDDLSTIIKENCRKITFNLINYHPYFKNLNFEELNLVINTMNYNDFKKLEEECGEEKTKRLLKKFNDMEKIKKIIGYKVPFELFNGEVKLGFIYRPLANINNKFYAATNLEGKVMTSKFDLPKEIVEQWKPVYEQELKAGDYVKINYADLFPVENLEESSKIYVLQIEKIDGDNLYLKYTSNIRVNKRDVKLPTKKEIKDKVRLYYFGEVRFVIFPNNDIADTKYGSVSKDSIKKAIDYLENPPRLADHKLSIFDNNGNYLYINSQELKLGFGCQQGTLNELKDIYEAFD